MTIEQQISSVNRQLNELSLGLKKDIQNNKKLKRKASRVLVRTMKNLAPIGKTGNLVNSIQFLNLSRSPDVFVGPNVRKAPHAHLVEFGFTHWKDGKKKRGTPFVKASYDLTKQEILNNLVSEAKKEFEKWGKKLSV